MILCIIIEQNFSYENMEMCNYKSTLSTMIHQCLEEAVWFNGYDIKLVIMRTR